MARKNKNDTFEVLWQGLVVIPGMLGFWIGFKVSHSIGVACGLAGVGAGLGIGILIMLRITRQEKLKRSGINDIDKMDGRQFEHYLGHLYKSQGYSVQVTRASGDYGADLVLQKDGKRIVVQAKRHKKNIGVKAVQEVQASIAHYKAQEGWVVSNRDYTEEAKSLAKSNGVRLVNRNELVDMILKMNPTAVPSAKQVMASLPEQHIQCDRCGKPMVLRTSAKGEFWGCSGFPKCRYIKRISG